MNNTPMQPQTPAPALPTNAGTDLDKILFQVRELTSRASSFQCQMEVTLESINESINEVNDRFKAIQSFFASQHDRLEESYQAKHKQLVDEHTQSLENLATAEKIVYSTLQEVNQLLTVIAENFTTKEII